MKKMFINLPVVCVAMAISWVACNGNSKKPESEQAVVTNAAADSGTAVHKPADTSVVSTEAYVAGIISRRQAVTSQLPGVNAEKATQLYHALVLYMDTAMADIMGNEAWLNEYANYYSDEKHAAVPPAKVQRRIDLLATAGIEPWNIGEGYTELRTVPGFYKDLFGKSLPDDYRAYLQLKADEDTVLYTADAGLVIPFSLVGKRALNWEKFLDTYPRSYFFTTAKQLYEGYCRDYLFGEDNTPSFDDHTNPGSLLPENKEEYISFIQQHGDTKTGKIVKLFMDNMSSGKTVDELSELVRKAIQR
ncbi:hypothetical protein [Chitinophaga sp. 212800010-3]|uniref:hypothetical protein n=1 Tax=unclassified Chitinophaga TaxID=2619133 RepID=UPI002DE35313|nr:Lipoprotein [Chitinophaga sp. 212800010-3]